jgi:hypothetical protein
MGVLLIFAALTLGALWLGGLVDGWWLIVALIAAAGGAFAIYEARHCWCALRAMGVRTPI